MRIRLSLLACAVLYAGMASAAIEADAKRGAGFFERHKCNTCHSVGLAMRATGRGGAPDLALKVDRDYTPAGIASRMWNHAPTMWSAMSREGITPPDVSEQDAADLFAFFYSARYFEMPGDAGRGKRIFSEKKCAECHTDSGGVGPRVSQWNAVRDPVALVSGMWNHIPQMKAEFAKRKISWPQLTSQDLADMMVYLRNRPDTRKVDSKFEVPVGVTGNQVFQAKGCGECHKGAMALENRLGNRTLTDIAVEMWNHGPKMKQSSPIAEDEMRQLLGHLWANSFFAARGNATRGKSVFASKKCGTCHTEGNAPKLAGAQTSVISMVSALWKHGPGMLAQMKQKSIAWPQFTANQMSDLVAYLAAPAK